MKKPFFFILFLNLAFASTTPYWIEHNEVNSPTGIWIKANLTAGTNTIYVYYGGQQSLADGDKTFEFFDDFTGPSLDTNKWDPNYIGSIQYSFSTVGGRSWLYVEDASPRGTGTAYWYIGPSSSAHQMKALYQVGDNVCVNWLEALRSSSSNKDTGRVGFGLANTNDGGEVRVYAYDAWAGENKYYATGGVADGDVGVYYVGTSFRKYYICRNGQNYKIGINGLFNYENTSTAGISHLSLFAATYGSYDFKTAYIDYIYITKYDPDLTTSIQYGPEETGSWTINGQTYTKRRQVNITANKAETDYQILLDYSQFNDQNLFVFSKSPLILSASPIDGFLTRNKTINFTYTVFVAEPSATVELYIDNQLVETDQVNQGTTTLTHLITVSYGTHTWKVRAYTAEAEDEIERSFEVGNIIILPHWYDHTDQTPSDNLWVKMNLTNTTRTIYVYYGGQQSLADGDKTFEFFDDFDDSVNSWTVVSGNFVEDGTTVRDIASSSGPGSGREKKEWLDNGKSFMLTTKIKETNRNSDYPWMGVMIKSPHEDYGSYDSGYLILAYGEKTGTHGYLRAFRATQGSLAILYQWDIQFPPDVWNTMKVVYNNQSARMDLYFNAHHFYTFDQAHTTGEVIRLFAANNREAVYWWDYIYITKYDPDLTTSIQYGPEETGSWTINGQTYTKRRQVNITANKAETDYQIPLSISNFDTSGAYLTLMNLTQVKISKASPIDGFLTRNKTINFTYTVFVAEPSATVELYIDNQLVETDQVNQGTTTLTHLITVSYGTHTWKVRAYTAEAEDEIERSFEVYFNVEAISPEEGSILLGNTTIFEIKTENYYPIICEYYLDTTLIANKTYQNASEFNITHTTTNGTHTWQVKCHGADNYQYTKQTPIVVFHQNYVSFENKIKLHIYGNVYKDYQRIFFDNNHTLWLLFFTDTKPSDLVYLVEVEKDEVKDVHLGALNATNLADYFVYLPATDGFDILTFSKNASEYYIIHKTNSTLEINKYNTSTITNWNTSITAVFGNTFYDPWSFVNLPENYTLTADSFVIFDVKVMTTDGEKVIYFAKKPNEDTLTLVKESGVYSTGWSVAPQETAPKTKNLSVWVVPYISKGSNNKPRIDIYEVSNNGEDWAFKNNTYEFQDGSKIITTFGRSADYLFLVINNATAYQSGQPNFYIYEALTNSMYQTNKQPPAENSFPIFTAPDTFNIFEPDKTVSVYFNGSNFDVGAITYEDYGLRVPYERGEMTTRETKDGIDRIVKGRIALEEHGIVLLYTDQLYDAKFITYDEQEEYRKPFKVLIYTNTSSYKTKDEVWGYVIPSALIGGLKNVYITGRNGTKRLYIVGLNNNYLLEAWSLNQNAGIYCTYTVYNQFQIPIPNARISALRYSDLKRSWVIVEQSITNLQGKGYLFLEPFTLYKIRVEGDNYIALEFDYTPVGTPCQVDVKLNTNGSLIQPMPDYHTLFEDISYSIQPEKNFHKKPFNITYTISSASGKLEWARMAVVKEFNHTKTVVYNTTLTSPTGGMLQYTANETGKYYAYCSFKHEDYDEYEFYQKSYWLGLNTGLTQAMEQLNENVISGWSWFLISLLLAVLVANFAAGYTKEGAGVLGIVTLWIMSLIYPNGIVVCLFQGACLTTLSATIFLTVLVGASLIATKYL